jgi:bacillopeptidase F (M6 metalloprotease family)
MASFVEKRICVNKNRNWIKSQLIESGEQETSIFGLDKYLEISNFIAEVFKEEINSKEKENSPFFAKIGEKETIKFIPILADFLYLSLLNIDKVDPEELKIIYNSFKIRVLENLNNAETLNNLKDEFIVELRRNI